MQDRLSNSLKVVEQGKQSGVIKISFNGPSPDYVTTVINDIEEAYIRQNVERHSADAEQSLQFLETQLPEMKSKLEAAQTQLKAYQMAHGSVDITQETQIALSQSVDLQSQQLQLQQQREQMAQRFTPQHPAVRALDQQLAQIGTALARQKTQSEKLPAAQQEILGLLRDVDVNSELYTEMLNTIQQLQVAKAGTVGNVRVVDFAIPPIKPIKPKPALIMILALVSGVALGIFTIILQRALIRGVDDPTEIERRFGLPTYAMVPFTKSQRKLHAEMRTGKDGNYILASLEGANLAIEALRSLRTSLHFALFESKNNVVMLTGPAPGLGKSFVSVNLGAVLAFSGKKVLLLDVDLRKGHLHHYVSVSDTPGIADYIAGDLALTDVIRETPVPGLSLITRGTIPPNPSELLLHERFTSLLQTVSKDYDYVLVDTPPVLAVTDAAVVAKLAGCTLVVLKSATHPLPQIEETIKRLVTAGASVKGTVFNLVGERAGSYGYGGYGYAYYNYETQDR
jgi:tyrosine-protein kinase Etk/Wzc